MRVSDVFLSYSSQDRDRVHRVADALAAAGLSVWWDRHLPAGRTYIHEIGKALRAARCVVVLWSKASIESDWVLEEATDARSRRVLFPVLIEDVHPPVGFATLHAANLIQWNGAADSADFQKLLEDIRRLMQGEGAGLGAAPPSQQPKPPAAAAPPARGAFPPAQRLVLEVLRGKPDVRWTADLIVVSLHEKRSIVAPPASEIRQAIAELVKRGYLYHDTPATIAVSGKAITWYEKNPRQR